MRERSCALAPRTRSRPQASPMWSQLERFRRGGETVQLGAGDMLVVEPGEAHIFLSSSGDYLHFVLHPPFVRADKVAEGTA
jgi:hypothetical protein